MKVTGYLMSIVALANSVVGIAQNKAAKITYDFLPREQVIFEDNQASEKLGVFPSKWKPGPLELEVIMEAQKNSNETTCKVQKEGNEYVLTVTQSHVWEVFCMEPTEKIVLPDSFTIEYDFLFPENNEVIGTFTSVAFFREEHGDTRHLSSFTFWNNTPDKSPAPESLFGFSSNSGSTTENTYLAENVVADVGHWLPVHFLPSPSAVYPWQLPYGKWHHFALSYRHKEVKGYINNCLLFVMPDCGFIPETFAIGSQPPVKYKNFRVATGRKINPLNKILTDKKFVTHAINFDVNKATIQPASLAFISQLAQFLKTNPAVKLEIDGHTDSDGDASNNVKLSQARADEVKKQLVNMGIDGGRLTTKGFGAGKPIKPNTSAEGKAENRRVEFIMQ